MHRRRRNGKQNKIILFSVMTLLLVMTIGYAAFNTQLNINVKGNVLKGEITTEELKNNAVTSGDGLYADTAEDGRYIYKGLDVDNYITFNDETWRIMSVESDNTIKIIKEAEVGEYRAWDSIENGSGRGSYCNQDYVWGCNAWAATSNLVGTPTAFTIHYPNGNPTSDTESHSGTVDADADINTYLNGSYYNSLSSTSQSYITNHDFNVGTPGTLSDTEDIATDVAQEALYKWNGKIGLMTVTEFMRTTTNTTCTSLNAASTAGDCGSNNWMKFMLSLSTWTISPTFGDEGPSDVFKWRNSSDDAQLGVGSAENTGYIHPTLYLKSDIILSGSGTEADPYQIQ